MKLKPRTIPVLLSAFFATPAFGTGSDDAGVNRLLVEGARLAQSAERASSESDRLDHYRRAKTAIVKIMSAYPESSAAAKLATGRTIGNVSLERINEALRSGGPCEAPRGGHLVLDCVLGEAKRAGAKALDLKESGGYRQKVEFDEQEQWRLEADLAITEASAGDFSSALKQLDALEALLPVGKRRNLWPRSWSYLDALGPVACKLARAGYDAESRALFRKGASLARLSYSPGLRLRSLANDQACARHFDDALDTAARIPAAEDSGRAGDGEVLRVLAIAELAETALDDGLFNRAATILDTLTPDTLPADPRFVHRWPESRSALVRALAKLGAARVNEGDHPAADAAFERALDAAGDGRRDWAEIGRASVQNRNSLGPTAGPGRRAREAVGDLLVIAAAMHAAGKKEWARRTLADAELAAGEEPGPLAAIAAARFRIAGGSAGEEALARAEEELASSARAAARLAFMGGTSGFRGPRCSHDHAWFERTEAFNLVADQAELRFPPCENGPAFTDRIALASAYLAQGNHAGVEAVLSCGLALRTMPDETGFGPFVELAMTPDFKDWTISDLTVLMAAGEWPRDSDSLPWLRAAWNEMQRSALARGEIATHGWQPRTCAGKSDWGFPVAQGEAWGKSCPTSDAADWIVHDWNARTTTESGKAAWELPAEIVKVHAGPPPRFTVSYQGVSSWSPPANGFEYPDALRARLARQLAEENRFDDAIRVASRIFDLNRRAEVLTELASRQVENRLPRAARATLAQAFTAAEDIPEAFPDALLHSWSPTTEPATIQDRAIRFAGIARVLAELLPYE